MESITIPKSVTFIKEEAFLDCPLLNVEFEQGPPERHLTIGQDAFAKCNSLQRIHIPGCVTSICSGAFSNCANLAQVTFEQNGALERIGEDAFARCSVLTAVAIPSSVTQIERYAFRDCTSLRTVTIESLATMFAPDVFENCPLENVYCNIRVDGRDVIPLLQDIFGARPGCTVHFMDADYTYEVNGWTWQSGWLCRFL